MVENICGATCIFDAVFRNISPHPHSDRVVLSVPLEHCIVVSIAGVVEHTSRARKNLP